MLSDSDLRHFFLGSLFRCWNWMAVGVLVLFCAMSLIVAIIIDEQALVKMYLKSKRSVGKFPSYFETRKWRMYVAFKCWNWIASWMFAAFSIRLLRGIRENNGLVTDVNRMDLAVSFVLLTYLATCFTMQVMMNGEKIPKLYEKQPIESFAITMGYRVLWVLKLVPILYIMTLFLIVLHIDTSMTMRCFVAAVASMIILAGGWTIFFYETKKLVKWYQLIEMAVLILSPIATCLGIASYSGMDLNIFSKSAMQTVATMIGTAVLVSKYYNGQNTRIAPEIIRKPFLYKKRQASYPPPFPNGWFALANSDEIQPGTAHQVCALGQTFVVYRGDVSHEIGVLNAYCTHMGANLAQGKVVNDEIVCPFHEWQFNAAGKCTKIPYAKSDKYPEVANTTSYPVMEYYGFVLVYFDAEKRAPTYEPPKYLEIDSHDMVFRGEMETSLDMHLLEFCENSADNQHFSILHGQMMFPYTKVPVPCITIDHTVNFHPVDETSVSFKDSAFLRFMGIPIPRSGAKASISISGPAGVAAFKFMTEIGNIIMFEMHTPVEPLKLNVRFRWYADKSIPRFLVWYVIGNWISQIESDRSVWENKVHLKTPVLIKEDGPIKVLRRWFNHFYSENSANVGKDSLDW